MCMCMYDNNNNNNTIALCLLCRRPTETWCSFLSTIHENGTNSDGCKYDVFVMADFLRGNGARHWQKRFPMITFCTVSSYGARKHGFTNMNFLMQRDVTAWEKGLYYFAFYKTGYRHIWFFEDDVFIPTETTIPNLDGRYPHSDLLSKRCSKTTVAQPWEWHWSNIAIPFSPPYFTGMMCIVRVSARFLSKIKEYAQQEGILFFLEAMFPSLVYHFDLVHDCPPEFVNVLYRHDFKAEDIQPTHLYHPIKDLDQHVVFREQLHSL